MSESTLRETLEFARKALARKDWVFAREAIDNALTQLEATERDREVLRQAIEWCCQSAWMGCDIDGGYFQDKMVDLGLLVEVPASPEVKEEWDCDTMFTMPWLGTQGDENG